MTDTPFPDVVRLNRTAWDLQSNSGTSRWAQPVDPATIEQARQGDWQIILTPTLAVPRNWFGNLDSANVLALASGGGQQAPILAAAGAKVTSFDNSTAQLDKDQQVAEHNGLEMRFEQGDMADLSRFDDAQFDLIFHPVSNLFVQDIQPVWRECFRVLRPGGVVLAGFMNPAIFLFDHEEIERGGPLEVRFSLPFSDVEALTEKQIEARINQGQALEFSHSLDAQIGGQLQAGFMLTDFYEDRWEDSATALNAYMPTSMATRALKPPAKEG